MSANSRLYNITDSDTVIIPASDSREIILRNTGENDVFFGFNGTVSTDSNGECFGLFARPLEFIVFTGVKADSDIYARCNSGETSTLQGEIK
jgi:hypothetical protein